MKKRILSCLMALALCLTLLPTAALAEETEGTAQTPPAMEEAADPANGEAKQENQPAAPEQEGQSAEAKQEGQPAEQKEQQEDSASKQDEAVAEVQAMIDALPDAEALDGMDDEDAMAVYEAFQAACDAYYDLTEEQQAQLKNTEKLEALSDWFSQSAALAAGTEHTHYLCGGTKCNGEGHALEDTKTTFEPWTGTVATGAYYLTKDISGFTVPSGVKLTLCLNGYNITSDGAQNEDVITVKPGATFTLCDCKRDGTTDYGTIGHRRPDQFNGSGVTVENGTFNMYGGKIANNTVGNPDINKSNVYGGGVQVFNKGIFNMIGGEITGNRAKYGGGVSVGTAYGLHDNTAEDIGGTFNMTGGEISGNFCASKGGGVYACVSSKLYFTVSGSAQITDNYTGDFLSSSSVEGKANNVYLEKYTDDNTGETIMATIKVGTLDSTASIGVTTEEVRQTVATGVSEAAAKCFTCDDSSKYRLIYNSGERTLTMATAAHSEHPICGDVNCDEHTELTGWQGVSKLGDISRAGNYYLTQNVEITSTWKPVNGVVLCLNGYDITANGDFDAITIEGSRTFTLCDCFGGGKITHGPETNDPAFRRSGSGVAVENKGTFIMYGGSITGNETALCYDGGGVNVQSGGVFEMHGGTITNNVAYLADGGGVYVGGTFTMSGGEITGNTATVSNHFSPGQGHGYGGGVYVYNTGTVNISGSAKIYDNKHGEGTSASGGINHVTNNVCLPSGKAIQIVGELDAAASIGVTSTETLSATEPVTVATLAEGVTYTPGSIFSDLGEPSGVLLEGGNLNLYGARPHKHPICGAAHKDIGDHTGTCGDVTWTPWDGVSAITYDPENTAYVYLTDNVECSVLTVAKGYKLYLCLNGHSLTGTKTGKTVINVASGATLTLCDCSEAQTGKITHGMNSYGKKCSGRGVTVEGTFNMYGGSITGNDTTSTGGGVSLPYGAYSARFNLYGGSITNNTANNGGDGGGGVHILSGYFTMYDGRITENHADRANYGGGGVYLSSAGYFIMKGGSITNNTAKNGGGVYTSVNLSTGLTVSGDVTITGNKNADDKVENVYLVSGKTIEIAGALTGGPASIGVTTADGVAAKNYVTIAKGGSGHTTLTKDDLNAFTSDNTAYGKLLLGNSVVFTNGDLHTHPICGKTCADEKHTDKIWQGVSSLRDITEAGYYYLTQNVMVIGKTWKPVDGVVLCLNGNSIVAAGKFDAISVDTGVTFTLTDCKPEGEAGRITHSFDSNGQRYISRGVDVSGTFNLYDGSIADNDTGKLGNPGGGVGVADSGTFHMYGGKITGNTALSGGGVDLSSGTFTMEGGEITGNTAYGTETNGGGGVHVSKGTFTMSGNAVISGNTTEGGGGGVRVSNGTFTMKETAVISGNKAAGSGGGVCVTDGGTFTMEGGTIGGTDNGNTASGRGGGGVNVYNGTFTMKNGTISGNSADDGNGGGVYVQGIGGSFNMSGGTINVNTAKSSGGGVFVQGANSSFTMGGSAAISGNTAESKGGGVYMESAIGAFTMNGGTISGNKATGLNGYGGGVYVASNDDESSKFTMYSGTISGNTASDYGGVYVYSTTELGGTFTMNGGEITGNNGTYDGGGVYVGQKAKMTVSGGARIADNWKNGTLNKESGAYVQGTNGSANNLYLYSVAIGTLAETARIGITTATTPTAGAPVQFATGATNAALDYTTIFTPDAADQGYVVNKDGSGNLFLNAHRHSWTYALKEGTTGTITATCTADGCANRDGGSVMISASDAAYDRGAKAATVTASNDWKGDAVDSIAVKYVGREGTVYDSSDAPTNAGKYTASITLGEGGNAKTASVEYEITKVAPKIASWSPYTGPLPAYNGEQVKNPTYLPMTFGEFADITGFKWYQATKNEGNSYTKGEELSAPPTDAGDYYIEAIFKEGTNTTAGIEGTGLTVKPMQTEKVVNAKEYPVYANRAYTYEIDLNSYLTDLHLGTGVTYTKTNGDLPDYFKAGELSISSDGKLTVPVKKTTTAPLPSTIATIVVWVKSSNYGRITLSVPIQMVAKKSENLAVSMTDWTYGETANTPEYTVPDGVTATVTYAKADGTALGERPTDAGSYTVTVSYETDTVIHTGTKDFTISKREITVPTEDLTQFEYTGQEQTYVLGNFADAAYYTVSGAMTRTEAGSQNVTVQLKDKNNTVWKDGTDADKTYVFTIAPKPLSKVTIGDFLDQTYTGLPIRPAVVPVDGNTALTENTDYTVSYGANTNVGKATITVTGKDNYTGTVSKEWNITPAVLTISDVTVADKTYNGSADATITAVAFDGLKNDEKLEIGTDYEVIGAAFNGENVDTADKVTGTVALKDTEKAKNYTLSSAAFEQAATIGRADYNGTASKTVNIVKGRSTVQTGTLTAADFFPEGQMPDGAKITAWSLTSPTTAILSAVSVGGGKLSYLSAENIATASEESGSVTIATTNYKDITATLTFHPTDKLVQDGFKFENGSVTKTYGDEDFTLAATGEVKGSTVTYESSAPAVATVDGTGKVTIKGAGTAVITAKASATEDYDEAAVTCTLTVEKKPIAIPAADATVFTYNGTEQTYALAEDGAYTITGNKQTNANETGYSVTAALKDTANTQWADGTTADKTYTFVIGKAVITVKAKDQSAYVDDAAPTLGEDSYTVSGLMGEEKLTTQPTVKYVGADGSEIAPDMTKTGEVKILASGAAASDNYTIRYEDGKLTVSTRPSGGGGGSRPSTNPVQTEVGKDPDGSVSLSKTSAAKGDKVTITVKPERHYEVDEVIVRDSKGKQLAVKDNGDGTYTFEMPADKVTVEPTFTWVNPFADVANSAYYVDAVEWMLKREVTQGTTETTFSPNLNCSRAQIVTFLWRAAGSPEPKGAVSFADVSAGSYYAKAVAWAVENGITGGTGNGLFSPNATCTRAQSAAFLYRAAGSPAVSGSAGFSDVAADAYYARAVAWAKEHGITDGIGGGLFGSANDCTRAQIAAFLWRLYAEK